MKKTNVKKNEKFILDRTMHFGCIKTTFNIGNVFEIDFNNNKMFINGRVFEDIRDAKICINNGWLQPYSEVLERKINAMNLSNINLKETNIDESKNKVYKVIHSDADLMNEEIKIPETARQKQLKNSKENATNIIKEVKGEKIRGLAVLRQIDNDDVELAKQLNAEMYSASNSLNAGKVKVVTKSIEEAKLITEERKKNKNR